MADFSTFGTRTDTTLCGQAALQPSSEANKSGLQLSTIRNLAMAWVLTMPAAILLSGSLYWLFTKVF